MQDIGKVGIPSEILLKFGKLNSEEFALMKTLCVIGEKILEASTPEFLQKAGIIAGSHHERWDGSGYPRNLKGEDIPLESRIMNLADQYDALRRRRPYKPGLDREAVYRIITEGYGRTMPEHFCPAILDAFKDIHKEFDAVFEEQGPAPLSRRPGTYGGYAPGGISVPLPSQPRPLPGWFPAHTSPASSRPPYSGR